MSPALAQGADDGWRTTVYPIYGWLPLFGADVRLPEIPNPPPCDGCGDGGPIVPGGHVSSNLNGAAFAAVVVENKWVQAEANFLWAGLSADAERPNLKVEVDTVWPARASACGWCRTCSSMAVFAISGSTSRPPRSSSMKCSGSRDVLEGLVGASFTPRLSSRWRLLAKADYGGVGADNHSSYSANAALEWQPLRHLVVDLGYGFFQITVDGTVAQRPIHLEQTTHGPIIGIGIPF